MCVGGGSGGRGGGGGCGSGGVGVQELVVEEFGCLVGAAEAEDEAGGVDGEVHARLATRGGSVVEPVVLWGDGRGKR